jgi:hypothetical protein
MAGEPCVLGDREGSAAAALASVAQFYDLSLEAREVAPLVGLPSVRELGDLIVASRMLGFDSVPLEGGYDDLPEVARPNIVRFKDRFVVLYEIDADKTRVGDPLAGVRTLSREDFSAEWTGDCLQLVPADLDGARARLAAYRRWWRRLASPRALAFVVGAAALAALVVHDRFGAPSVALAVAAAASLWVALFEASCAQCSRAHQIAGALPLARVGVLFYAALLVGARLDARVAGVTLCTAVGAHAALVTILARERVFCLPCLVTAVAACSALALLLTSVPLAAGAALAAVGALAGARAVPFGRRLADERSLFASRQLALDWLRNATPPSSGQVRVVVWKRAGCAACIFYEAVFKPALVQDFEGLVSIEERDAERLPVATPLILVAGSVRFLFLSLGGRDDDYAALQHAVEAARAPSPLGGLEALILVGS